jgi:hypothetical protein
MEREPTRTAAALPWRARLAGALAVRVVGAADPPALRDAWRATWASRAVVWAAGMGGVLALGRAPGWRGFDPAGLTAPLGGLGDVLVAPAARWDSVWYLAIASGGYAEATRTAFFPLYPLLVRLVGAPGAAVSDARTAYLLAGIAISLAALPAALYAVHRLTALELGRGPARTVTWLVALFPTAFALSAVYTESLFLALSAGSLCAGRLGRWRWAGALGALAAASRSTGVLLVAPLALLYLYGPRADARPDMDVDLSRGTCGRHARAGCSAGDLYGPRADARPREAERPPGGVGAAGDDRASASRLRFRENASVTGVRLRESAWRARLRPRHRARADLAWLALVPAGLGAYLAYLALATGDPAAPFSVQHAWFRHFAGPFGGVWDGAVAAWAGVRQLASGSRAHVYFAQAGGDPIRVALHNVGNFAFLLAAAAALVGTFRRLPAAYGAWALCAVALPLSYPVGPEPLASLPRYLAVVFPLHMWAAGRLRHPLARRATFAACAAGLAVLSAAFAAWEWVA